MSTRRSSTPGDGVADQLAKAGLGLASVGTVILSHLVVLASCAAGPNPAAVVGGPELAGFWLGVYHGAISPITFVISLFNGSVSI